MTQPDNDDNEKSPVFWPEMQAILYRLGNLVSSLLRFAWLSVKWSFLLLAAVMTGFRLFAPDTYWTSNPGWSYEVPLAFFYAILLAIWLQRRGLWGIAAWPMAFVFMAFAYTAYLHWWRSSYYAYRLTIDVETPEGVKSGSSIARVRMGSTAMFFAPAAGDCDLWSEATVVDLGARGRLIALLPRGGIEPCRVLPNLLPGTPQWLTLKEVRRFGRLPPQTLTVPPAQWPIMIRFLEPDGPYYRAEKLDPAALEPAFGQGVRLKSVTVTVLDAGYWPFNAWRWPAFLAGVEVPPSRILDTIPPLNVPLNKQLWIEPCCSINEENFVQ